MAKSLHPMASTPIGDLPPELREHRREIKRRSSLKKYAAMKVVFNAARAAPCADCGREDLPPQIKCLHHVRGVKKFTVSQGLCSRSEAAIREEIAKCVVLCPTCHALRHHCDPTLGGPRGGPRKVD